MSSLCKFVEVENLDDFCIEFIPTDEGNPTGPSDIILKMDEIQLKRFDWNRGTVRLRAGPVLVAATGEKELLGYGREKTIDNWDPDLVRTVQIGVNKEEGSVVNETGLELLEEAIEFLVDCGSRGFIVEEKRIMLPGEILSLHSAYFSTLLYGDFKEKNSEWIPLYGITMSSLTSFLYLLPISNQSCSYKTCFGTLYKSLLVSFLRFSDRYSFVKCFENLKNASKEAINKIMKCSNETVKWVMELAEGMRDEKVMEEFFNRFHLTECLNNIMHQLSHSMTPFAARLLTQRMNKLATFNYNRPKIRFIFPEGELVCALFNDAHPDLVENLIQQIRIGTSSFNKKNPHRVGNGIALFLCNCLNPSPHSRLSPLPLYFASPCVLYYRCVGDNKHALFIHRPVHESNPYLLLGVVLSGHTMISRVSTLTSCSVVV